MNSPIFRRWIPSWRPDSQMSDLYSNCSATLRYPLRSTQGVCARDFDR